MTARRTTTHAQPAAPLTASFFKMRELARILNVSLRALRARRASGRLGVMALGPGRLGIARSEVEGLSRDERSRPPPARSQASPPTSRRWPSCARCCAACASAMSGSWCWRKRGCACWAWPWRRLRGRRADEPPQIARSGPDLALGGPENDVDVSRRQSVYARAALASGLGAPKDTMMMTKNDDGLRARMAALLRTPVPVLRKRYAALGKDPAGVSKDDLVKTLTEQAEGTPAKAPRPRTAAAPARDPRLPAPGGSIKRTYKGREYTLEVLDQGFRVGPKEYRSSSAAALGVTAYEGTLSGPAFWGYAKPATPTTAPEAPAKAPRAEQSKRARKAKK